MAAAPYTAYSEQVFADQRRDAHKLARAMTCNRNKEHPLLCSVWCHWHQLHSISRVRYTGSKTISTQLENCSWRLPTAPAGDKATG